MLGLVTRQGFELGLVWFALGRSVLMNSDILTANYGVKQNQFTKPTPELLR